MTSGDYDDDDAGYVGYVPSTVDLGSSLMAGAVFGFLLCYFVILPLLVVLTRRRQARRQAANETFYLEESDEDSKEEQGTGDNARVCVDTAHLRTDNRVTNNEKDDADGSVATANSRKSTASSHSSVISSAVAAILDHPQVPKSKAGRKRRRKVEREIQKANWSGTGNDRDKMDVNTFTLLQGIYPGGYSGAIQLGESPGQRMTETPNASNSPCGDEVEPFVKTAGNTASSGNISPSNKSPPPTLPILKYAEDFNTLGYKDKMALVAAWDVEMKRIVRLSAPYCTQALITGLTDTMNVAVIGKLIGTNEVSAFVIVNLLVELTSDFVGGLHEALATLCSQAIGANNKKLAGEYVQIVVVLYTLFFIPFMLIWAVYMGVALEWLGFDEEIVAIGKTYNYILVFDLLIDGLGEAIHGLLDVGGLEKFSTLIGATEEILAFLILLFVALFGNPDLVTVGLIQFGIGLLFLVLNICIIYWKGWFKPYLPGMTGTFALWNGKSVWLVAKTALSLSFGMLLTDGEWEILTIFASFLGPAEVAAWGILDTIWSATHELIDAIADASEVRCAFLLGSGDPDRAKVSAYKSMLIGVFAGIYLTALIYICGDDLPTWLTTDPTLQKLLRDLLPLFGLGNLVMALDTMSWTLLGSQGRYRLATVIVCLASWIVTIPLAVLFSVHFNVNLQGQMTAFIIGYLAMGVTHSYYLLVSDWNKLSMSVMEDHEAALLRDAEPTASNSSPVSPSTSIASAASPEPQLLPMELSS